MQITKLICLCSMIWLVLGCNFFSYADNTYPAYQGDLTNTNCNCSIGPCGSTGERCDYSTPQIQDSFYYMMQSYTVFATNDTQLLDHTESVFVSCNQTNDHLKSCLYAQGFTTTTDQSSATGNPNKQAIVNGQPQSTASNDNIVQPLYCPLRRCDVVTDDIWARYYQGGYRDTTSYIAIAPTVESGITTVPSLEKAHMGGFRAMKIGGNLCLITQTPMGYAVIGCKTAALPPNANNISCATDAGDHSKAFISVSGRVIECVTTIIENSFIGNSSKFYNVVDGVRASVQAALVLYVILFGIRVATSGEPVQKGEIFQFIMKMILVTYFAVGIGGSNGMVDIAYPLLKSAMYFFSDTILSASSNVSQSGSGTSLCYYDPNSYAPGYDYLALWDAIDCRIGYYFGFFNATSGAGVASMVLDTLGIITLFLPMLISGNFLFLILTLLFAIFLLSIVIYFVHLFILAILGIALLTFIAPIFVPMALFKVTSSYFNGWMHSLISFTLQPCVVSAFLAIMLSVFDSIVFGDCQFISVTYGLYQGWVIDPNSVDTQCTETLGYMATRPDVLLTTLSLLFFNVSAFAPTVAFLKAIIEVTLFAFLFYFFSEKIGEFAAELTGGPSLSKIAINPLAGLNKLKEVALKKEKDEDKDKESELGQAQVVDNAQNQGANPPANKGGT